MPENNVPTTDTEIPTPEEAYRIALTYMSVADERVSGVGDYDSVAQFYMAKAKVWAELANVNSFGSVLLESGPPWVGFNEEGPISAEEENLKETKKSLMLGEFEEDDRP